MPERWLVLTVRTPSDELMDSLAEGLLALGGSAVEEDVDLLTTYVPEPPDPAAFLAAAADRLAALAGREPEMLWRWQRDEDWSRRWKEGLAPRRVGRRVVVTQPWNPVEAGGGDLVIVIDPATAFGTGEHATTRGALELMERTMTGGERVLDVGTGSAILAIAAVGLGAAEVVAVESDAAALANAGENLDRNGAAGAVRLAHAIVDEAWLARERGPGFDLIVGNVLSGVLVPLLPPFVAALRPDGRVILGGILAAEVADVLPAAEAAGLRLEDEIREGDGSHGEWWSGLLRLAAPLP